MHQSSSNKEVHTEEEKEEHSPVKKNQKLGQINDLRALQIKKKCSKQFNSNENCTANEWKLRMQRLSWPFCEYNNLKRMPLYNNYNYYYIYN